MGTVLVSAACGAVAALLLVAFAAVLRRRNRTRADLEAMLDAALRESDDLRARLEELTTQKTIQETGSPSRASATYLITDAGRSGDLAVPGEVPVAVPDRLVLSATLGAPLVKAAALGHGVRRALSPENRNRIWFEMRRQVRSSRKRRRREVRDHLRQVRADERAREGVA
jgi:hypothetical protein